MSSILLSETFLRGPDEASLLCGAIEDFDPSRIFTPFGILGVFFNKNLLKSSKIPTDSSFDDLWSQRCLVQFPTLFSNLSFNTEIISSRHGTIPSSRFMVVKFSSMVL